MRAYWAGGILMASHLEEQQLCLQWFCLRTAANELSDKEVARVLGAISRVRTASCCVLAAYGIFMQLY